MPRFLEIGDRVRFPRTRPLYRVVALLPAHYRCLEYVSPERVVLQRKTRLGSTETVSTETEALQFFCSDEEWNKLFEEPEGE